MGGGLSKLVLNHPDQFSTQVSNEEGVENEKDWRQFDIIIVGGGTAGCVLASRLSEEPNVQVLLIEAGKSHDSDILTRIPLAFAGAFKTATDWNYSTIAQKNLAGREVYCPRGKILGGSSAINALVYHHCAPEDFDQWVKLGATGWSYDDLKPYFRKAEKYTPSPRYPGVNPDDRGNSGPLLTGHSSIPVPINDVAIETCKRIGIPYIHDLNAGKGSLGVTSFVGTLDEKGQRSSTATAYLTTEVLSRPNLTVAINTTVEKILFDKKSDTDIRAIGVELSTGPSSPRYRVRARSEVILSAGAIGTPQILLVSGVGPAEQLNEFDIPVVRDLPAVGKHLSDHISSGSLTLRAKPGVTWDYLRGTGSGILAILKWLIAGRGPLSALGAAGAAFVRSDDTSLPYTSESSPGVEVKDMTSGPGAPDIELYWIPTMFLNYGFTVPPSGSNGITMGAVALKPESTGSIVLRSASIWDKPVIDPNHLGSESDLNVVVRGTRLLLRLARSEPLKSILDLKSHSIDQDDIFWPGDADPDKVSDEELKQWIRRNGTAPFHPTSSARIGTSPETSVVDPQLRVHGIAGLRIMDASVFPVQISGHPCAVIIAMAERTADLIKDAFVHN